MVSLGSSVVSGLWFDPCVGPLFDDDPSQLDVGHFIRWLKGASSMLVTCPLSSSSPNYLTIANVAFVVCGRSGKQGNQAGHIAEIKRASS